MAADPGNYVMAEQIVIRIRGAPRERAFHNLHNPREHIQAVQNEIGKDESKNDSRPWGPVDLCVDLVQFGTDSGFGGI